MHAYLIMAHNHPRQLSKLIELLDDERNVLFIHIDKKSKLDLSIKTKYAEMNIIESQNVYWADYTQIEVELRLLEVAYNSIHNFSYYHLLSGNDLPIKTQDVIHQFFDNQNDEFIAVAPGNNKYHKKHVQFYYPLLKINIFRRSRILKILEEVSCSIQSLLGIDRIRKNKNENIELCDGWTWFSITNNFVKYILSKKEWIYNTFISTKAPDEMAFQTLIWNSPFKAKIHNLNDYSLSSLRKIDWKRPATPPPYTWREGDYAELLGSECLFARKFNEDIDDIIINKIYNTLMTRQ